MGIHFQFLSSRSDAAEDLRVRFSSTSTGSRSALGRDNDKVRNRDDTMVLDLAGLSADDEQATILRMFGRALGLRPEQRHPESGIQWDWDYLRENYAPETIEEEYQPVGVDRRRTEPYDRHSIMHAVVYEEETMNLQRDTRLNTELSQGDWNQLLEMYPAKAPSPEPRQRKKKSGWRRFQECIHGPRAGRA
ncbi:hypothetical protein PG997_001473 [Apiospora hydei]|uniref:Uncharacterized protein n=1 Tax=Apiospora hydei TaxID=1337664 RepID=A0ABR1XDV0_9PEZI